MMQKIITIKYRYSIDFEIQRVLYTFKKLKWFQKNNYRVMLPQGIDFANNKKITESHIREVIKNEYKKEQYKKISLKLNRYWKLKAKKTTINLLNDGFKFDNEYIVYLTKYGVGGSYTLPNEIILNYQNREVGSLIKTIIYEIVHLSIESLIKKHKILHWQKERIVDLIVLKIYPEWKKTQNLPFDTSELDDVFFRYYPDINKIIKSIKKTGKN